MKLVNRRESITIIMLAIILFCVGNLTACGKNQEKVKEKNKPEASAEITKDPIEEQIPEQSTKPVILTTNWKEYFGELEGAAVFYNPNANQFLIYNEKLAEVQRSPCSTFKIISSLIGLERGVIDTQNSVRAWSGETFWKEEWNQDISFEEAFAQSCVWYYRQVIDDIGKEVMQKELDQLSYGNCDISDWQGLLNNNNKNPALTGFWIESSLLISAKEQTEVLERIFKEASEYSPETVQQLKNVMYLPAGTEEYGIAVYGKTGMGKSNGITVDAWYTGFIEKDTQKLYFCIYLGESKKLDVSSTKAKEIAISLAQSEQILALFR